MFDYRHTVDLIIELTKKEIKIRYKNSVFGYLWSILNPLLMSIVLTIALSFVAKFQEIENYHLILLCGLFPWQWFYNSVTANTTCFISNTSLIKKVNFNWILLTIANIFNDLIHFILSIPVLLVFLLYNGINPSLSWVYVLPVLLAAQFLLTFGISSAVATLNVYFRDIERITSIVLQILYFLSAILYPASWIPEKYKLMFLLNPLVPLIDSYRNLFMHGTVVFSQLLLAVLSSLIVALIGYMLYSRLKIRIPEVI